MFSRDWKTGPPPSSPTFPNPPLRQMFNHGWDEIYFDQFRTNPHELLFLAVHDFRYLQMKNIYYYQMEICHKFPSGTELNSRNIEELRALLAAYCQALQNYEFVLRLPNPSKSKVPGQRQCLEHVGKAELERNDHRIIRGSPLGFLDRVFTQDLSEARAGFELNMQGKLRILFRDIFWSDVLRRICVGTFVGAPFILVPMIILQFHTTIAWRLSTVSVAVILFSIFLGISTDQSNSEHLVAVAAYAAVMVVFVGTTTC